MKKNIIFIIVVLLTTTVASYVCYNMGFANGTEYAPKADTLAGFDFENEVPVIGKIDYPLIEINFEDGSEWIVVDRLDWNTKQEKLNVFQDGSELQLCKEYLKVLTFPTGRGITPEGIIYIYRNGFLVKEVPYFETYYEDETINNAFQQVSKENVEKIINQSLPSPI